MGFRWFWMVLYNGFQIYFVFFILKDLNWMGLMGFTESSRLILVLTYRSYSFKHRGFTNLTYLISTQSWYTPLYTQFTTEGDTNSILEVGPPTDSINPGLTLFILFTSIYIVGQTVPWIRWDDCCVKGASPWEMFSFAVYAWCRVLGLDET